MAPGFSKWGSGWEALRIHRADRGGSRQLVRMELRKILIKKISKLSLFSRTGHFIFKSWGVSPV